MAAVAINGCWQLNAAVAVALEGSLAARDVGPDVQQVRLEQEPWLVAQELLLEHLL